MATNYHRGPRCKTLRERFWVKVQKSAGCWLWTGTRFHDGHGCFVWQKQHMTAHRAAWMLSNVGDPGALQVMHRCGNKLCVRPDHLFLAAPEARLWNKVQKGRGCWIWLGCTTLGYGRVRFRGKLDFAHRVAWILTNGEISEGLHVLHRCDNRKCVRPEHLFLGTLKDNVQDCMKKGRHYHGEQHWTKRPGRAAIARRKHSKLTAAQVKEMRQRFAAGETNKSALAREFRITHPTVRKILAGRIWKKT